MHWTLPDWWVSSTAGLVSTEKGLYAHCPASRPSMVCWTKPSFQVLTILLINYFISLKNSLLHPSSKRRFSQPFKEKDMDEVVRIGTTIIFHMSKLMPSSSNCVMQYSGKATGEIWNWSLLGVKGLCSTFVLYMGILCNDRDHELNWTSLDIMLDGEA